MSAMSHAGAPEVGVSSRAADGERLRSAGSAAGALVGGGVAMLIPALIFAWLSIAFSTYGRNTQPQLTEPWLLLPLGAAAGLIVLGGRLSTRQLRRWRGRGAGRLTAVGVALAAGVGVLADAAMLGVMIAVEGTGFAPTELLLWPVAGGLGWVAGAFAGRAAWTRIGEGMLKRA